MTFDHKRIQVYNQPTSTGTKKKPDEKLIMLLIELVGGQPDLGEQSRERLRIEEIFDQLEPYARVSGAEMTGLQTQFTGTVLEGAFLDFPQDQDVSAEALHDHIFSYLMLPAGVQVSGEYIFRGRETVEKDVSEAEYLAWQSRAARVQRVATTLVPGKQVPPEAFSIYFTPRLKDERQLILKERKLVVFGEEYFGQKGGSHLQVDVEQVRVFALHKDSWTERARVAFVGVREYSMEDDEIGELREGQMCVALLPIRLPANTFDKGNESPYIPTEPFVDTVGNTVSAALPAGLPLPEVDSVLRLPYNWFAEREDDQEADNESESDDEDSSDTYSSE